MNNLAFTINDDYYKEAFDKPFSINSEGTPQFIEFIKKSNKLPFPDCNSFYSDDLWDFSSYLHQGLGETLSKFAFHGLSEYYSDICKQYVLLKILENKDKLQVIHDKHLVIRRLFKYVISHGNKSVDEIIDSDIADFISAETYGKSPALSWSLRSTIRDFYLCYSANIADIYTPEIESTLSVADYKLLNAYRNEHKTPMLSDDFYNKYVQSCIEIIKDIAYSDEIRAAACFEVIVAQTGLRRGEVACLEYGCLHEIKIFNGERAYYLNYKTWKREKNNNISIVSTYINDLSKLAIDSLYALYEKNEYSVDKQPYLFLRSNGKPYDSASYAPLASKLCKAIDAKGIIKLIDRPDDEYPEVPRAVIKQKGQTKTIMKPSSQEMRYYVCTKLYEKGVPLKYIQKFMSHLTAQMTAYHIEKTSTPQENMEYSLKVLREIVSGDAKLLGDSKNLTEKINQFIQENNFHVKRDLNAICDTLAQKIPIRQKTGGVCIKSSMLRECSHDAITNEFYCAYGVCPNIYHFYYMADVSYRQCRELSETIAINKKNGFIRQVQKEHNMLIKIITSKLEPELDELQDAVKKHGYEEVCIRHPEISEIIENYDSILKEVLEWKTMNL